MDLEGHEALQLGAVEFPDLRHGVVPHDGISRIDLGVAYREPALALPNLGRPPLHGSAGLADGELQADILDDVRIVDAARFDQHTVFIQDMVGRVHIDPVLPLDLLPVGNMLHVGGYHPRMDIRLEQGARHLDVAPVGPRHQAELHLDARREVLDVRNPEIFL